MITYIGVLRALLAAMTLALVATAPFADHAANFSGVQLYTNVIGPALAMIVVFVFLLEMTMTGVFMANTQARERRRYRHILWLEAGLFSLLLASWSPFLFGLMALTR